jgi:putative endonuclease
MSYYVYIMTNYRMTVLYIGVTNDLERRVYEHKKKLADGFTKKYNLDRLVYFEETDDVTVAIEREKQLKRWVRRRKAALVATMNPEWRDLAADWYD